MAIPLRPTEDEIGKWMLVSIRHSSSVEYFMNLFGIQYDHIVNGVVTPNYNHKSERPHDICGPYNRFDWPVLSTLALQFREPLGNFCSHVSPGVTLHRKSYHHKKWNKASDDTLQEDLALGAIDANQCMREPRFYREVRSYTYDQIPGAMKGTHYQIQMMMKYLELMRTAIQPRAERIEDICSFPNIGMSDEMYKRANEQIEITFNMLKRRGYNINMILASARRFAK